MPCLIAQRIAQRSKVLLSAALAQSSTEIVAKACSRPVSDSVQLKMGQLKQTQTTPLPEQERRKYDEPVVVISKSNFGAEPTDILHRDERYPHSVAPNVPNS